MDVFEEEKLSWGYWPSWWAFSFNRVTWCNHFERIGVCIKERVPPGDGANMKLSKIGWKASHTAVANPVTPLVSAGRSVLTWDCLTSLAWSLAITLKCLSNLFVFDSLLLPLTLMQDLCHLPAWLLRLPFAAWQKKRPASRSVCLNTQASHCQQAVWAVEIVSLTFKLLPWRGVWWWSLLFHQHPSHVYCPLSSCMFKYFEL